MVRVRGLEQKPTKNRSSKHLRILTGSKPALWSMNGEELRQAAKTTRNVRERDNVYVAEIERRLRNAEKRKTPRPRKIKEKTN